MRAVAKPKQKIALPPTRNNILSSGFFKSHAVNNFAEGLRRDKTNGRCFFILALICLSKGNSWEGDCTVTLLRNDFPTKDKPPTSSLITGPTRLAAMFFATH